MVPGPRAGTPLVRRWGWEHKLECSFKSQKNPEGEAELAHSAVTAPPLRLRAPSEADHRREMNHAAGPGAADEPGRPVYFSSSSSALLLSLRDTSHRPGSCCSFIRLSYHRPVGSQLSERESPHWSWTLRTCLVFLNFATVDELPDFWVTPADFLARFSSPHILDYSHSRGDMFFLLVVSLAVFSDAGQCDVFLKKKLLGGLPLGQQCLRGKCSNAELPWNLGQFNLSLLRFKIINTHMLKDDHNQLLY